MKLVDRREIVDGEVIDILAGGGQRREQPIEQAAAAVMAVDVRGGVGHALSLRPPRRSQ